MTRLTKPSVNLMRNNICKCDRLYFRGRGLFAYIAALLARPAFTARFRDDLIQPGLRVPLTADATLFARAAAIGPEVVWLHSYGERYADSAADRPKAAPRLPAGERP